MRKIIETLRLHFEYRRTNREISRAIGASPTTVCDYLRRAKAAGLSYPLPSGMDERTLELGLFPVTVSTDVVRPEPDWTWVHCELRKKSVTLELLWQEYKAAHPDGYQYSWFCACYRQWAGKLSVTMRYAPTVQFALDWVSNFSGIRTKSSGHDSIYQIAKMTGRDYRRVYDVTL